MTFQLRPYQEASISALYTYMYECSGNPLVVLPTGAGKSIVIAEFIRRALAEFPDTRVLILAHVPELLMQNMDELLGIWPQAPVGIYSASLGMKKIRAQVLFAGIQSIHNKAVALQKVDIVIIDECHLLSPNGKTMYRRLLDTLLQINPDMRIVGLSATPYRLDSGHLCNGKNALFHDVAYEAPVGKLIDDGYLSKLTSRPTNTDIDVTGVKISGGDYVEDELAEAVTDQVIIEAVGEMVALGKDRRTWLAFCPGVARAYKARDAIRDYGISCETITGGTDKQERKAILDAWKRGGIRCVTNANCLTTGINVRPIDLIAFIRPTLSLSLYVQMAGRGMRLSPETGKTDCMVLDFAKLIETLGPIDQIKIKDKRKKETPGQAPSKKCPQCETTTFAAARECPDCGYEFPPPETKIQETASTLAIIAGNEEQKEIEFIPQWVDVTDVRYDRHSKLGQPDSLRVTYQCGMLQHREWICLWHTGGIQKRAAKWWRERAEIGDSAAPDTIETALSLTRFLRKPKQIAVRPAGKYTEIVGFRGLTSDVASAA